MIMSGAREAILRHVQPIDIHGTRFYDLGFAHTDAPDAVRSARVGSEDVYPNPQPGDAVVIRYLMNVVVGVERR